MNKRYVTAYLLLFAIVLNIHPAARPAAAMEPISIRTASEDVVLQWNRVLTETLAVPRLQPATVVAARSYAMMHGAIFDAVNSIDGSYTPYRIEVPGAGNASIQAAAAMAARDVLTALYPSRASIFEAEFQASIAGRPSTGVRFGIIVGRQTAAAMLSDRANDGWNIPPQPYSLSTAPGNWQPTPPAFAAAAFTHYPNVRPFAVPSTYQFLPPPPPALESAEYAAALNSVKAIGSVNSVTRTADQTQAALAWASVATPTGVAITWNNIARSLAASQGTSTVQNARLFAMLNMSHHDAFQTAFASKYYYGLWRAVTAIRRSDEDGNPATSPDPSWTPLLATPPYPTYAGNMATIATANTSILSLFFGRDDLPVQYTFPTGATRSWLALSSLADEIALSREYGGIHFRFDSAAGKSLGSNTGNYIFTHLMKPR